LGGGARGVQDTRVSSASFILNKFTLATASSSGRATFRTRRGRRRER
jgi:hypothetical protein